MSRCNSRIGGLNTIARNERPILLNWASMPPLASTSNAILTSPHFCRTTASNRPSLPPDRKSIRLNSSHNQISYPVFCLKKKKHQRGPLHPPLVAAPQQSYMTRRPPSLPAGPSPHGMPPSHDADAAAPEPGLHLYPDVLY